MEVRPSEIVYYAPKHAEDCPPVMFKCESGECIHRIYQGDGHCDCADGSDEFHEGGRNCSVGFYGKHILLCYFLT